MQGKNIEATETQWDLRQASKFTHYTAIIDNFLRLETQGIHIEHIIIYIWHLEAKPTQQQLT